MKYAGYLLLSAVLVLSHCTTETISPQDPSITEQKVALSVSSNSLLYKKIINPLVLKVYGTDMDTIRLDESGEDPECPFGELKVPVGADRTFRVEAYSSSGDTGTVITDTGSVTMDIGSEKTVVSVSLYAAIEKPVITQQPVDIQVNPGDSVVFTIGISGDDLYYSWEYLPTKKTDGGVWGENDSMVIEPELLESMEGVRFFCTVFNSAGYVYSDTVRYILLTDTIGPDTVPPVLELTGDTVMSLMIGDIFTDPGATAYDLRDGNLTDAITVSGTVTTSSASICTLTYSVSDSAGNETVKTRAVIITDSGTTVNLLSEVKLNGADTVLIPPDISFDEFMKKYSDPGIHLPLPEDSIQTLKISNSVPLIIDSVTWRSEYSVEDQHGNKVVLYRYFVEEEVVTPSTPVITLVYGDSIIQVPKGMRWIEPGYSADDEVDGDITEKVIVDSAELVSNLNNPGSYKVTYTVTNAQGLTAVRTRHVQVLLVIVEPPVTVLTLKGFNPDTVLLGSSSEYIDSGATAVNDRDGDLTAEIACSGTVDMNATGTYKLVYMVTDSHGNRTTEFRQVVVVLDTADTDLRHWFGVPSADPLPEIGKSDFTSYSLVGDAPDISAIRRINFHWNPEQEALMSFNITFERAPHFLDRRSITQTFASSEPEMTLVGTTVPGLDGEYYVTVTEEGWLVWVEKSGKFAIVWKK